MVKVKLVAAGGISCSGDYAKNRLWWKAYEEIWVL